MRHELFNKFSTKKLNSSSTRLNKPKGLGMPRPNVTKLPKLRINKGLAPKTLRIK